MNKIIIREIGSDEYEILEDFLYLAIFVPAGVEKPAKSITRNPELQVYVKDFGKIQGDCAMVAEDHGKIVGACWARIMNDYGHIDDQTPSLAISLAEAYRGCGIGTKLITALLEKLKEKGYERASLAVQKENRRAVRLYHKVGFKTHHETAEEYVMVRIL